MKKYISTDIELEVEGGLQWINIDGYVYYAIDMNWGSDADGNRGEKRTIVSDIVGISAHDEFGRDFDLIGDNLTKVTKAIGEKFFEGE